MSALVEKTAEGRWRVPEPVHHLPDLLDLSAEAVLERFITSQGDDVAALAAQVDQPEAPLSAVFRAVREQVGPDSRFAHAVVFQPGGLTALFRDLHAHVMAHPVWRHPFFVRVFEGRATPDHLRVFACHYFNQVKNTRQCVALSIGRFHGLETLSLDRAAQPVSDLTQVILAQLIADEYGVGTSGLNDYPSLHGLFTSTTHVTLYRRMLDALGVHGAAQDVPLLPEVADNVLTQRLVAGHPAFSPLESLASVGLGMEWGVPEFFSLLLGGFIRVSERDGLGLTPDDLDIFIAHVKYDVLHAVSVVAATALHICDDRDVVAVKNAVNILMAARYGMMDGLYHKVFDEPRSGPHPLAALPQYHITDARIVETLKAARATAHPGTVEGQEAWVSAGPLPFFLR